MRTLWRRIRSNWNWTDTVVVGGNTIAFALFIGNVWWESLWVCYAALAGPLLLQAWRARADATLRPALAFGSIVGLTWPIGEGVVVRVIGWWGRYLQGGPYLWDTSLYCALIGWLACSHIRYVHERILQIGYRERVAVVITAVGALGLGAIGENLFVHARMWEYDASTWDWGGVPAFVPIAYGLSYAFIPWVRKMPVLAGALTFNGITGVLACGLGIMTGFFPR